MGLKPIRRIPSQNIEILAETSEVVLCKRNLLHGNDHEYVTWLK
jgi:hypothetical protein